MAITMILVAAVLLVCVLADKCSGKLGMPALILFMFVGMLFGSDGLFKIPFSDYELGEEVCTIALLFIMFYGGFNTKWNTARATAGKSLLLSTAGVLITAGITAGLCIYFLHYSVKESFLLGAVLSSTDAASVFSILRKKKLNLKYGTAPLLEIESGSNDPIAYMLTLIGVSLMGGADINIPLMLLKQVSFGILAGVVCAFVASWLMTKTQLISEGLDTIFLIAMVLLCYGVTEVFSGNEFLSVYLFGILLGNSPIKNKNRVIPFFDGVTTLAQILIFFLLGLLTFPHELPEMIPVAAAVCVFLTLIARPIAVFALLLPFRCSVKQCLLISWAGLRGAASSYFALVVIANGVTMTHDLFHIVFLVSLFSVAVQGTLLPAASRWLDMLDESADVRKTFNDYQEDSAITLMRMHIPAGHNWENRLIRDVTMPTGSLAIMIKRNSETIITKGDTMILAGDDVILSVPAYEPGEQDELEEIVIDHNHTWRDQTIANLKLPPNELIAMIIRGDENLIPDGKTVIEENDIVVMYR